MRKVSLIFSLVLAGVFLYAGAIKAISSGEFALAILPFASIPESVMGWIAKIFPSVGSASRDLPIGFIATVLPYTEIVGAVLILLPWTRRYGAALILLLCLAFIAILGWALANDIIVACSCFGKDEEPSAGKMVFAMVRDVFLAAMAIFVMIAASKRPRKTAEPTVAE